MALYIARSYSRRHLNLWSGWCCNTACEIFLDARDIEDRARPRDHDAVLGERKSAVCYLQRSFRWHGTYRRKGASS